MKKLNILVLISLLFFGAASSSMAQVQQPPQDPPPPPPQPAPCDLKNVPACIEAGKTAKFTIKVAEANGTPIHGATVDIGDSEAGTTNSSGHITVSASCGAAGSNVVVTVKRRGESAPCASKTINCYNKDKDGRFIIDAENVAQVGMSVLDTNDLISHTAQLTYFGMTFEGPQPDSLVIVVDTEVDDELGISLANVVGYDVSYPGFSFGGVTFGDTTVSLIPGDANVLMIDTISGEVTGNLETEVKNTLLGSTERHLQLTGTYFGGVLDLSVAGFLPDPPRNGDVDAEEIPQGEPDQQPQGF